MSYRRRRRLAVLGAAAVGPACMASPSDDGDAGGPCAPAAKGSGCFSAQGEPLPYEIDAPVEGELTAVGTPAPDHCDVAIWGPGSGESVTFQVTEASGRIVDVQIDAGGLDAYLAAHPLVVGEPVRIDLMRACYDVQGEETAFRWLRDGRLAAAVVNLGDVPGVDIRWLPEVVEPERDSCCVVHVSGARVAVEDTSADVEVAPGCAVEADGLTISNIGYFGYEDLGCCNALGGPYVTVVARP